MMKNKVLDFCKSTTGRYVIVGVGVYGFELIVIAVSQLLGAGSLLSVALSFWLGLIASFFLQKLVTFQDKRMQRKILLPQIVAVSLLVLFNFGFTILVTDLLGDMLTTFGARTLALGITVIWNFYLYKTRIFKHAGEPLVD